MEIFLTCLAIFIVGMVAFFWIKAVVNKKLIYSGKKMSREETLGIKVKKDELQNK